MAAVGAITAFGLLADPAAADLIHLKNGNTLEGDVLESDAQTITVRIPGLGDIILSADEVASIEQTPSKADAISEMSYRMTGGPSPSGIREMGVTILEFPDRIIMRRYRQPRDDRPTDPENFFDESQEIPTDEYEYYWDLLPLSLKQDVWSLTSDSIPPASDEDVTVLEATFRRDDRSVVYRVYGEQALKSDTPMRRLFQFFWAVVAARAGMPNPETVP